MKIYDRQQISAFLQDKSPGKIAAATGIHRMTVAKMRDHPELNVMPSNLEIMSKYMEDTKL